MDFAKRGAAALEAGKCDEAIKEYSAALRQNPKAVDYYLKRSSAYQRSSPPDYTAALKDAETGLHYAFERARRELIGQAQLRRATIMFNLGQYANAQYVLEFVKKFDEKNKTIAIWESKIATRLKTLAEDDENAQVTAIERPKVELSEEKPDSKPAPSAATTAPAVPKAPTQTPPSQIKHDWYQNKDNIYFSLLAKGVPQDKATIDIEDHSISISFPTSTGSDFNYTLDPLFAAIDSSASTSRVTPTKVELTLKKKEPGQKWRTLEGTEAPKPVAGSAASDTSDPVRKAILSTPIESAPSYPTSSKTGPKNWDKVVSDITKKPKAAEGDDAGGADDMDDLDYGGDEANFFFKQLYSGADEDTKRAMMKSYVESNGTVLSTNWSEVGKGKVETSPPDGMEAKNWGQ